MTRRVELSVGNTTGVPSLADQIKRFQPKVFANADDIGDRVFDRTAKDNPAREPLAQKCVRVIVDNFERLPAHDTAWGSKIAATDVNNTKADGSLTANQGSPEDITTGAGLTGTLNADEGAGTDAAEDSDPEDAKREKEQQQTQDRRQDLRSIPAKFLQAISAGLSTTLAPKVGALYVFDENYWKRRCVEQLGWPNCKIAEHGLTWKQLFFEVHVSDRLENFDREKEEFDDLLDLLTSCQEYIFTLRVKQFLAHIDMRAVCDVLPNLTMLDVTYTVRGIGMKYDRMMFGMKISDADCLARAIQETSTMVSLILQGNLMNDDLLRMLMKGLSRNSTITYLDASHNKITNHGARLLSKLLGENSVLTSLNIADNQIHAEGGRYLGRALRANTSLVSLNVRLNRLTDDGGRMLVDSLHENPTLNCLNLSANSVAGETCTSLGTVLKRAESRLATLDLSCNELQDDDVKLISVALTKNSSLTSIDLRMNDVSPDLEELWIIELESALLTCQGVARWFLLSRTLGTRLVDDVQSPATPRGYPSRR